MKISDRLQKDKFVDDFFKEAQNPCDDFFSDLNENVEQIIKLANANKNLIFICDKSFDKPVISKYIASKLPKSNLKIFETLPNNPNDDLNGINIFPSPDIKTFVQVLEQIIYGYQSFIVCLNFGNYENIINKLKVSIALNYPNLSVDNINTLLSSSNAILINVLKDNNGLIYFSSIEEIKYIDNTVKLEPLFQTNSQNIIEPAATQEEISITPLNEPEPETESDSLIQIQHQEELPQQEKKPNKYQILREKIKQKRQESQE